MHLRSFYAKNEIAKISFLIRSNLEQNQIAQDRVKSLCIIKRLVRALNGFTIDPQPILGVVLDLDRQIPMNTLDKDFVFDGNMGMFSVSVTVTGRPLPLEGMLAG